MKLLWPGIVAIAVCSSRSVTAQAIEFESNGLKYQTLTKNGLTLMFTYLPTHLKNYTVMQVAISNGSSISWTVRPEDFTYKHRDGSVSSPVPPRKVVDRMLERGGRSEVIKLVTTYEAGIYGMARINSTNGYEQRRQAALAEMTSAKLKAAAAAAAVVYVSVKLSPGQSTDGAIFYPLEGKPFGPGTLIVRAAGEVFEFVVQAGAVAHDLLE